MNTVTETTLISTRVPVDVRDQFYFVAASHDRTPEQELRIAIKRYLQEVENVEGGSAA